MISWGKATTPTSIAMTRLPPFGSWLMDHVHSRYSKYNQTCKQKMKYISIQKLTLLKSAPPILRIKYEKKETKNLNQYLLFLLCGHVWSATPMRDGCVVHILRTCSYRIARTHRSTMFVDGPSIPQPLILLQSSIWQRPTFGKRLCFLILSLGPLALHVL